MQYSLSNGKDTVYQWDKNITITIQEPENVPTVHFKWGGKGVPLPVTNQQVEIPVELLQLPKDIVIWAYTPDHTMDMARIPLEPRPKPADYIYTPTVRKARRVIPVRLALRVRRVNRGRKVILVKPGLRVQRAIPAKPVPLVLGWMSRALPSVRRLKSPPWMITGCRQRGCRWIWQAAAE